MSVRVLKVKKMTLSKYNVRKPTRKKTKLINERFPKERGKITTFLRKLIPLRWR